MRTSSSSQTVFWYSLIIGWLFVMSASTAFPAPVEAQPLRAQARRVGQALELVGSPLSAAQQKIIEAADVDVQTIQNTLDPLCISIVRINAKGIMTERGAAVPKLVQGGWRAFLVKVQNEAGVTGNLRCTSPSAEPVYVKSTGAAEPTASVKPQDVPDRWLDIQMSDGQPLNAELSGFGIEYRLVQFLSRDAGKRSAKLSFDVEPRGDAAPIKSGEITLEFDAASAAEVTLHVLDDDGTPTVGGFTFRDGNGRVYPSRTRRLSPDFYFHDQVYRADGETVSLPAGTFDVTYTRGPEYRVQHRFITVPDGAAKHEETFRLQRWIKLADLGWYSGDHHIHAAGCNHYESPTQGVTPEAIMRHVQGEDLNVGEVLSWGPCWYFQKQFFDGKLSALSKPRNLLRYDVEVSGFPSSHAGHLCLLGLTDDDFPDAERIEQWPSWDLPVLRWAKKQPGAVVGFSHSGWGLAVSDTELPSYEMPRFDSIGANEYVIDVTHDGAVDFISAGDTPIVWELSVWYHTLNCGFPTRISGETDFPCIYGDRVGMGRSYVKVDGVKKEKPIDYNAWLAGIKAGRSYVSDGLSHLIDFNVGGVSVGEPGPSGGLSVLPIRQGAPIKVKLNAAAMLEEKPREDLRHKALDVKPFWHAERARFGNTRSVRVELVVSGKVVDRKLIEADGRVQEVTFDFTPTDSCWVAARILGTSHTNPVFLEVEGKPIRASRRSARWCLDAVDVCWKSKEPLIRQEEKQAAAEAYEAARKAYRRILVESRAE